MYLFENENPQQCVLSGALGMASLHNHTHHAGPNPQQCLPCFIPTDRQYQLAFTYPLM